MTLTACLPRSGFVQQGFCSGAQKAAPAEKRRYVLGNMMKSREFVVGIIAALLGFLGAIGGSFVGGHLDQSNWKMRFAVEQRKLLYQKRLNLIEDLATLYIELPTAHANVIRVKSNEKVSRMVLDCIKMAQAGGIKDHKCNEGAFERNKEAREIAKRVYDLKAQLEVKQLMATMLFGQKTKKALEEMTNVPDYVWYSPSNEHVNDLIKAMYIEISL